MASTRRLATALLASPLLAAGLAHASANIVLNSYFRNDLSYWEDVPEPGISTNWTNYNGGAFAITVSQQAAAVVLEQCINVLPSKLYGFGAEYRISSYFPGRPLGGVTVNWVDQANCYGTAIRHDDTPLSTNVADAWQSLSSVVQSPSNAKSVYVSLTITNPTNDVGSAYFEGPFLTGAGIQNGDVNLDGSVDAADVFFLINFLFSGGPRPSGPADVDSDFLVNVSDAFYLVNYLFSNGPAPK